MYPQHHTTEQTDVKPYLDELRECIAQGSPITHPKTFMQADEAYHLGLYPHRPNTQCPSYRCYRDSQRDQIQPCSRNGAESLLNLLRQDEYLRDCFRDLLSTDVKGGQ